MSVTAGGAGDSSPGLPWHPHLKRRELSNGLKILALTNQYPKDRFYMYLDVNVGSTCEDEDQQGIAHYLEHVVFLGTEKWKTAEEMREVMAGLGMSFGGDTNASTDQKNTVYTMESPAGAEKIQLVTEILHQMAFRALLTDECVNSERPAILSEKQMRNTISYRRSCKMMEMMHGHNILPKRLPIGLEEQIENFSAADLRRFYEKWYHPGNMTIYIAGVFDMDVFMEAVEKTFGAEPKRDASHLPIHPTILHTYARPEGERVRTFLHDLQTQFSCTLEQVEPLDSYKTEADYERETCDQLVGLCLEDRIDQIRSSSADPPFTGISWDAACDAVFCCKSVSLSVTSRPHDWKGAMTVAVTEICKLGKFGISADELALAKSTLLKDMEDDAEQNETIPSLDWLEDLMDREALEHVFSDKMQDLEILRRVLPKITLEMVIERCKVIAKPIVTLLEDSNTCGVMLCGPVDPLAVMHTKSSEEEDDGKEEGEEEGSDGSGEGVGEGDDAEMEESWGLKRAAEPPTSPSSQSKSALGKRSAAENPTPNAGAPGRAPRSPVKSPKGSDGQVAELGWDGQAVQGWPVTPEAWLRSVEKALRVELSPHDISVPKFLVDPAELEQKCKALSPAWLPVQVRGLGSIDEDDEARAPGSASAGTRDGAREGSAAVGAQVEEQARGRRSEQTQEEGLRRSSRGSGCSGGGEGRHGVQDAVEEPPAKRGRTGGAGGGSAGEQEVLKEGVLDAELGIRFWRLSNGVRVSYKYTDFEAGQVVIKIVSRGGKMVEIGRALTETSGSGGADVEQDAKASGGRRGKGEARRRKDAGEEQAQGGAGNGAMEVNRERRGLLGEMTLALDTLMDSGLGMHSAQDVERYLSLYAIGVDSNVSMESVTITLTVSTSDEGLERVLQVAHAMLGSTRFDEEALLRAKKERKLEHEHRKKSLNGLTWEALMRLATGEDPRFSQLTPAHIDAITLPQSAESLQAALRPENLEIVIVGDVEHSNAELAKLLQLYLGTLAGGVPANHPSAVHWRHCMSSLSHPSRALPIADASHGKEEAGEGGGGKKVGGGKAKGRRQDPASDASGQEAKPWNLVRHATRVTLVDEEPRAVVHILFRTCGFYGQTAGGGNLTPQVKDSRRLHLVRSLHVLSKVLNNRLHDELREKMGLGYSASFGTVQYTLLDGGMGYLSVTAFPDKMDKTISAALTIMKECSTSRPVTQTELMKARDPILASEKSVLAGNSTWLSYCTDLQSTVVPKELSDVRGVFKHYGSLTCDDINEAAGLCLRPKSVYIAVGTTTGAKEKKEK